MTTTKEVRDLERAALSAHARGLSWSAFWREHGDQVRQAEPDRGRYLHLLDVLLALLVCGDTAGMVPMASGLELLGDDQAKPADVGTRARLLR